MQIVRVYNSSQKYFVMLNLYDRVPRALPFFYPTYCVPVYKCKIHAYCYKLQQSIYMQEIRYFAKKSSLLLSDLLQVENFLMPY